jgi:hypothetical protein
MNRVLWSCEEKKKKRSVESRRVVVVGMRSVATEHSSVEFL